MLKQLGLSALFVAAASAACWSESQGYPCCSSASTKIEYTDASGSWGIESGDWCGIPTDEPDTSCWAAASGYKCCSEATTKVEYTDSLGKWGVEAGEWCGIVDAAPTCWAEKLGYKCCENTSVVVYTDDDGKWGSENGDWCGIVGGITTTTTTRTTRTTTRKTTTTVKPTAKPTYTVIYDSGNKLKAGWDNWGWDSSLSFKDGAMVIVADKKSYGAISLKDTKGGEFTGGSLRMDIKGNGRVFITVENTADEINTSIDTINAGPDFETYKIDIDYDGTFDRINIQDGEGNGDPIYVRFLIYSTGSAANFVDPINTTYVPSTTTRKPINARYTTIFTSAYSMPSGYDNWGWGCSISYTGGAIKITPEEGEYGALSLKKLSGSFKAGTLRFDMKNEGKVKVLVENSDTEEKTEIALLDASDEYVTHIIEVSTDGYFDRINFQDAKGTGDVIYIKNLVHSTGYADEFVDPL